MVLVRRVAGRTRCWRDRVASSDAARSRREVSADAGEAAPPRAPIRTAGPDHIHIPIVVSIDQAFDIHAVLVASSHPQRAILTHACHRAPAAGTATFRTCVASQSIASREFPRALGAHVRSFARVEFRVALEVVQTTEPCLAGLAEEWLLVRVGEKVRL